MCIFTSLSPSQWNNWESILSLNLINMPRQNTVSGIANRYESIRRMKCVEKMMPRILLAELCKPVWALKEMKGDGLPHQHGNTLYLNLEPLNCGNVFPT